MQVIKRKEAYVNMSIEYPEFPEFRRRFLKNCGAPLFLGDVDSVLRVVKSDALSPFRRSRGCSTDGAQLPPDDVQNGETAPKQMSLGLDLGSLQRDDGPPSGRGLKLLESRVTCDGRFAAPVASRRPM